MGKKRTIWVEPGDYFDGGSNAICPDVTEKGIQKAIKAIDALLVNNAGKVTFMHKLLYAGGSGETAQKPAPEAVEEFPPQPKKGKKK